VYQSLSTSGSGAGDDEGNDGDARLKKEQDARAVKKPIMEKVEWKQVQNDVFRKPKHALLLSVLVGTGAQVACMAFTTIFFMMLGIFSPVHRDYLYSVVFFSSAFYGNVSGYVAARLYRLFNGTEWLITAWATALALPVVIGVALLFIDYIEFVDRSVTYIPVSSISLMFIIWGSINLPNVLAGAWVAFKKAPIEVPVKVSRIPRDVPEVMPFYTWKSVSLTIGGFICFFSCFSEVYYLITSIWRHAYY